MTTPPAPPPAASTGVPRWRLRRPGVLPGFGLSFGITIFWVGLIVVLPLAALVIKTSGMTWAEFTTKTLSKSALNSYTNTFGLSGLAALINLVMGTLTAWVLVRYRFPGRRIVDALVDLPFALPTAVAGLALTALFSLPQPDNGYPGGWIGRHLPDGWQVNYSRWGVLVALTFISLPFVVRTVQPVLEEIGHESEEAAASLGATRGQIVLRVLLPQLLPSLLTGFALGWARAIGEYGSVYFIAGGMREADITPHLIIQRLEAFDYKGAMALGTVMLTVSLIMLVVVNLLQRWASRRAGEQP